MKPTELQTLLATFELGADELARALSVSRATVRRWVEGHGEPSGLHDEILRGLHSAALKVADDESRRHAIGGKIALGIGALIFYGLAEIAAKGRP